MGSGSTREQGAFVGQLSDHARRLHREARKAIAAGDYARASELIDDAELLAADVHALVDDFEERQTGTLLGLAAQAQAERAVPERSRSIFPARGMRMAIGAGLAMSFALVEC